MSASRELVSAATDERGVTTLTLNRPDKGNAYVLAMIHRLMAEIERSGASPEVRAIVLRGAGKHFCVGGDLDDPFVHIGTGAGNEVLMPHLGLALDACPKPTIALIHGACFGGGFALMSCCDVVLAAEDSFFSLPEL
ncbi:MAG: enoyl-CoA hydratase/isomerase family protein, partial [Bradyrhizobiaceae bacterium]|nr:enoyl-CoA hydratase/isomerase family protein [Bradyrhizobiaceae bacterium]